MTKIKKRNKDETVSSKKIEKNKSPKDIGFSGDIIKFGDDNDESKVTVNVTEPLIIKHNSKRPLLSHFNIDKNKRVDNLKKNSEYCGRAPVDKEKLEYYSRGKGVELGQIDHRIYRQQLGHSEKLLKFSFEQATRSELLLTQEAGYLIPDEGEVTSQYSQREIAENVDITSATKHFDLDLNFGPYRFNYSRNGRHLLLGGRKGHVAAFDWVGKKLSCEINVMEEVFDVSWLHNHLMFAVAQKKWLYLYDNQGVEMHCIKHFAHVLRMEFLPYHFLLATSSEYGYLGWLDVSIGKLVAMHRSRLGRLSVMTQNPYNAIICLGHPKGVVSMWSPNVAEPVAKVLCHHHPITGLAVDPYGQYMVTSAADRSLKIWDVRQLSEPIQNMKLKSVASQLQFSQRGCLGVGMGNVVEVFKDMTHNPSSKAYLCHQMPVGVNVNDLQFCPYEDVLGVGHFRGFTSCLVPGSGEPNFDALEVNPYQNKAQRRENEVKSLLHKIQPELISLDPDNVSAINIPSLKEKIEEKTKLLFLPTPKIDFTPRKKAGKSKGSVKAAHRRKIVKEQFKTQFRQQIDKKQIEKELRALAENPEETERKKDNKPQFIVKSLNRFKINSSRKKIDILEPSINENPNHDELSAKRAQMSFF